MRRPPTSLGFAVWWVVLFALHSANVAYYAAAALLYRAMRWTNINYQLSTYSIGIHPTQYYNVATIHGLVVFVHFVFMTCMFVGSIQARRLVFAPVFPSWISLRSLLAVLRRSTRRVTDSSDASNDSRWRLHRSLSSFSEHSLALSKSIFGREGLLGVDGVYFDHFLLTRELIETTLQTIQVYRMSYLLPRAWLIRFYVVLLIANCWSTPLIHRYYSHRHAQRRLMSLLCDAVLDVVSSIGVSLWIFTTYVPEYTDPEFGFPFNNWFDDVWFTTMQQEFQMMIVVSWADMASRLVFAAGLLQCMDAIKDILKSDEKRSHVEQASDGPKVVEVTAIVPFHAPQGPSVRLASRQARTTSPRSSRVVHFLLEKAGPAFFIALGFVILVVHIVSETRMSSTDMACRLVVRPWFVTKPACSLVELNCHDFGGVSGSQASMDKAWNTFEFGAAARIVIRHCPQLEVPPSLQLFHQITGFKLYNCTVVSWSTAAAFTAAAHPSMRALFIARTEFPDGKLPPGLLSTEYPKGLRNFITSATNLRTLPKNLDERWPQGMTLTFELSQLHEVPPVVMRMNTTMLSFAGSPIATIPPALFESPVLRCLILSYMPIQELPRVVKHPSPALYLMFLEGTNVSTFWSWMDPFVRFSLWMNRRLFTAHGTRYCNERDKILAGNRTNFGITMAEPNADDLSMVMDMSTPETRAFARSAVTCGPGFPFYFPLGLQDAATTTGTN